jgi:polysaccharide export outer membrane protein
MVVKVVQLFGKHVSRLVAMCALCAVTVSGTLHAAQPSAAQIEMFKSLPKSQQAALIQQYAPNMAVQAGSSTQAVTQDTLSEPAVTPREVEQEVARSEQSQEAKKSTDQADLQEKQVATAVKEKVKPFGYDLFAGTPSTFAPLANAPVPADYIMGPGDTLNVQIYGADNDSFSLQIDREGNIQLPNVGPVQISGMRFNQAAKLIELEITRAVIGVNVSVTAGALRSIRVFVLGDVFKPGAYVVSGLSTMSNALLSSGGIKTIGSLRNIQLKRNGKVISTLDLYDFLLKGDMSKDVSLLDGDVLFVPTLTETVIIAGEVKRPAVYELKKERSLNDIINLAGGFTKEASPAHSKLERIRQDGYREVKDINLLSGSVLSQRVQDGDALRVLKSVDEYKNIVLVKGSVSRPGEYQWREGLRVADLFKGDFADVFMPQTDLEHVFIKREVGYERKIDILMTDLKRAIENPADSSNLALQARDELLILNYNQNRVAQLAPWVSVMQRQAKRAQLAKVVKIFGSVNHPGTYPLVENMTFSQILSLAGGATMTAMPQALVRHESQFNRKVSVDLVDLNTELSSVSAQAMDELIVLDELSNDDAKARLKQLNDRLKQQATAKAPSQIVSIQGSVRFPGEYPLVNGMTAQNLIDLAGGLVESAYEVQGEVVSRSINAETRELDVANRPVQLQGSDLQQYALHTMDSLVIKQKPDWVERRVVTISGEVTFPGSYVLRDDETLAQLLQRAGGLTNHAFVQGTVLQRSALLQKQSKQLEKMRFQLESIIAQNASKKTSITNEGASEKLSKILAQANQAKATGRLSLISQNEDYSNVFDRVLLKDEDAIYIPEEPRTVSVIGEVFTTQTFSFDGGMDASDYIQMAGGPNSLADMDRAYIVKASGRVEPLQQNGFFYASSRAQIEQGDVIVIPMDVEKLQPIELWKEVATIAGQIGLALASFNAVGVF